ncbi:hypothetical protein H671_5g14582 [Cricetulus griseus]|nr:hypothetical protein H671_5g14582 [Cricetulus griseus]
MATFFLGPLLLRLVFPLSSYILPGEPIIYLQLTSGAHQFHSLNSHDKNPKALAQSSSGTLSVPEILAPQAKLTKSRQNLHHSERNLRLGCILINIFVDEKAETSFKMIQLTKEKKKETQSEAYAMFFVSSNAMKPVVDLEWWPRLRAWLQMCPYKEEEGLARCLLGCGQSILKGRGCITRSRKTETVIYHHCLGTSNPQQTFEE